MILKHNIIQTHLSTYCIERARLMHTTYMLCKQRNNVQIPECVDSKQNRQWHDIHNKQAEVLNSYELHKKKAK